MASDPKKLAARVFEADLISYRGLRVNGLQNWKNRIAKHDQLYRGDWTEVFGDESVMTENPHVMNMVQVTEDEIGRLTSEAVPSVIVFPKKDTETQKKRAEFQKNIADTYWDVNEGESLIPQLAMDLVGTGAAFIVSTVQDDCEYPVFLRIDPRVAYPTIVNNKLVDLLVVEEINWRVAANMWPELGLDTDPTIHDKNVELLHYYSKTECVQAVMVSAQDGSGAAQVDVISRWDPKGKLPAAFVKLDTGDGQFRGIFDQITGSLETKNRLIKLVLEYMDELVYAPFEMKGVMNLDEVPGPGARYILDTTVPDARVQRVQPAGSSPEVFSLLEFLDREQRGGVGYPAARQGEVSQSIASASFVTSTQGQLTTSVKNVQRLIALLRQRLNEIAFFQDETFLDFEKMLSQPVGDKNMYLPSKAIAGNYRNKVQYGAGAGLDRLQADNRVLQLLAARVIGKETARRQVDFINSPQDEGALVDLEQSIDILLQKLLSTADQATLMKLIAYQLEGMTFPEAAAAVQKEQEAAQQAQAPAPVEGAPPAGPAEAGPQNPEMEMQSMMAGGAPVQPRFAPPPTEQIFAGGTM